MVTIRNTGVFQERLDSSPAGRLLKGAIDMHVHLAPALQERRQTALEVALTARENGMKGVVLKNPHYQTAPIASLVSQLVPEVWVIGGICLEYECGGINPHAVEAAAKLGARIVWLPTFSSSNSLRLVAQKRVLDMKGEGISLLDERGRLLPEAVEVLEVVRDYDLALATGHISRREILTVTEKAKQIGITKMLVTHCGSDFLSETILSLEEKRMLVGEGVFMEYSVWQILPQCGGANPADIAAAIRSEGAEHCVMSTDCGGLERSNTAEGMWTFIAAMLRCGLTQEEITLMVKRNPARLLGL